jgi:hypothetical protein
LQPINAFQKTNQQFGLSFESDCDEYLKSDGWENGTLVIEIGEIKMSQQDYDNN